MKIKEILMLLLVSITIAIIAHSFKKDFEIEEEKEKINLNPNWKSMSLDDFRKDTLYSVGDGRRLFFKCMQKYGAGFTVTPRDIDRYQFFIIMFYIINEDTIKWYSREGWYPLDLTKL